MNCIIIDDEPLARKGLQEYIGKLPQLNLIGTHKSVLEAQQTLDTQEVQLIFLDIYMPQQDGISMLRQLKKPPLVIITTAYSHYAAESYEYDVVDYLLKPVSLPRMRKAVRKAHNQFLLQQQPKVDDHLFVKDNGSLVKVLYKEICYVEAKGNYCLLHQTEKKIIAYLSIKTIEARLPKQHFFRSHKSFIINLQTITEVKTASLVIGTKELPISRKAKPMLLQKLEEHILKR